MNPPPPRIARIVLVTPAGGLLGALAPVPVATPWWQDIAPVIDAVRAWHGVEITVLRLLSVGDAQSSGVEVAYLAETSDPVVAEPWDGELDEHPLRLAYARPGGPGEDLAWARGVLALRGQALSGPSVQVRTWNLSSLWRMRAEERTVWLKVTPPFFAHEGALLAAMAGEPVPRILGRDGGRILMEEIPGDDLYEARQPLLSRMVELLVDLQSRWVGRTAELLRLGLPDWRAPALTAAIGQMFERNAAQLTPEDRATLEAFIAALPGRFGEVADCGLPDTLVHGDFHPGNLRGADGALTLLDWGDSSVGHPLLDQPAFLERIAAGAVASSRETWRLAWEKAAPGSDPTRAAILLAPIAAARQAVTYQGFLDRIEPSEHPYHSADPADRLRRTAEILRTGAAPA